MSNLTRIFDNNKNVNERVKQILIIIKKPNSLITPILALRNEINPTIVVNEAMVIVGNISFVEAKTSSLLSVNFEQ